VPWDPAHPYQGLGFRQVRTQPAQLKVGDGQGLLVVTEKPLADTLKAVEKPA
jgi:hypothetical protein